MISFQDMLFRLRHFWSAQGCVLLEPYDMEMGAGTFHPATTLACLGPKPWRCLYVQPSRRPSDGRYGENPNRLQKFLQMQVIIKPSPSRAQELYLDSLKALDINLQAHDIRFVEDDWESPTLGAAGLGWEVWCDGAEITQFTYFQQMAGFPCDPVSLEITYGLERLAMVLQKCDNVYNLLWHEGNGQKITYGDLFLESEKQFSAYNFEHASITHLTAQFIQAEEECRSLIKKGLPLPAYDQCIKASHLFNLLDARGALSVIERAAYIARIRHLVKECCDVWQAHHKE